MLVHFITTATNLSENIDSLRAVMKVIKDNGHVLTRDWIEDAYANTNKGSEITEQTWQSIIDEDFEAIAKADVIIAEISSDSTAIGYQVATAIHQKKPTLLVLQEGKRVPAFTWNIPSTFLRRVEYNKDNAESIIRPFLIDNDISTKDMRFNFFIDRPIYNYLRWAALKTGKTKAEVLRGLVQREIDTQDK